MKYMLLVYLDEQALSDTEREHCYVESAQLTQDLHASGQYLSASPLHPVATATSVRVRDGRRVVTDGPFAETREQLGGFYLIEAHDLDEALTSRNEFRRRASARLRFGRCWKLRACPLIEDSILLTRSTYKH